MPASDPSDPPAAPQPAATDYAQAWPRPPERTAHAAPPPPLAFPARFEPQFPPPPAGPPPPGAPAAPLAMPPAMPPTPSPPTPSPPMPSPPMPVPQPTPPPAPAAAPPAPRPTPLPGAATEMARKLELEAAMQAEPGDRALRAAYFNHLGRLASSNTGLLTANLPELGTPLHFRCGTPDIAVLAQSFRDDAFAFEMRPTPLRILVIGAYAGFSTVDLARRFPHAQVLAVEPLPDNFRLLQLNTGSWRRIQCVNAAVWHHRARLQGAPRFQADWSIRLHDQAAAEDRAFEAITVQDLIDRADWSCVDLVVCDATGAEREVFANPNASWLFALDAAIVRLHEPVAPRATEWVGKALEARWFEHRKLGEMELYVRREPRQAIPPRPPEIPLVRTDPGLTSFVLADVPATTFGFFVYDGCNCQIHPNAPPGRPARALFTVRADGHRRFVSGVLHAGRPAAPVVFTAAVQREDGSLAGRTEAVLRQRESGRLVLDFPVPLTGTVRVALQTELAPGATTAALAWARWLEPKLV